jgi:2-polyprenyl-6-methoxyphenol hydroxylase-like FAD-dependent oxidoreductase
LGFWNGEKRSSLSGSKQQDCCQYLSNRFSGDVLGLAVPALHTPENWPGFLEKLRSRGMKPITHFYRYDGKKIAEQPTGAIDGMKGIPLSRAWLYQCLFEYAQELGVVVNFGQKVLRYFDAKDKGGVMTADGKTYYADLVVAADGVGSKSQSLVIKDPETPVSSGYALYRATFPLKHALKDSIIAQYSQNQADSISVYLGPDVHCVVGRNDAMNTVSILRRLLCVANVWLSLDVLAFDT